MRPRRSVSWGSMCPIRSRVRFLHGVRKRHWSSTLSCTSTSLAIFSISSVLKAKLLCGCSKIHGMCSLWKSRINFIAALRVRFPSSTLCCCTSVSSEADFPHGKAEVRTGHRRLPAGPKLPQGGANMTPTMRPALASAAMPAWVERFVRLKRLPKEASQFRLVTPARRQAFATPPVPPKRSATYRPFRPLWLFRCAHGNG